MFRNSSPATNSQSVALRIINSAKKEKKTVITTKSYPKIKHVGEEIIANPDLLKFEWNGEEIFTKAQVVKSSSKIYHIIFYSRELVHKFDYADYFCYTTKNLCPESDENLFMLVLLAKVYDVVSI